VSPGCTAGQGRGRGDRDSGAGAQGQGRRDGKDRTVLTLLHWHGTALAVHCTVLHCAVLSSLHRIVSYWFCTVLHCTLLYSTGA